MPVQVACTGCQKVFQVKSELAGKRIKCPKCKSSLVVPHRNEADDDSQDEQASELRRFPWPWVVGGGASVLCLITLIFAINASLSSGAAREELATAQTKAHEAAEQALKERASLENQVRTLNLELEKLKKSANEAGEETKKAQATVTHLEQLLVKAGIKVPSAPKESPPPQGGDVRSLLLGRWRDVKSGRDLGNGAFWGDMVFAKDGTVTIQVRDTKSFQPVTMNGTCRVLDDQQVEITLRPPSDSKSHDSPSWLTIDMAVSLISGSPATMKAKVAVSKTTLTFAGVNYERVGASAAAAKPPDPNAKAEVKVTKVIRARVADIGNGQKLTPNFPDKDVVVILKIENLPLSLKNKGSALFRNAFMQMGEDKRYFNALTMLDSGVAWAAGVIPQSVVHFALHLDTTLPFVPVSVPAPIANEAKLFTD